MEPKGLCFFVVAAAVAACGDRYSKLDELRGEISRQRTRIYSLDSCEQSGLAERLSCLDANAAVIGDVSREVTAIRAVTAALLPPEPAK